jgi:hypothetical protein
MRFDVLIAVLMEIQFKHSKKTTFFRNIGDYLPVVSVTSQKTGVVINMNMLLARVLNSSGSLIVERVLGRESLNWVSFWLLLACSRIMVCYIIGETAKIINGEGLITYGIIVVEIVYCHLELCHNIIFKKLCFPACISGMA